MKQTYSLLIEFFFNFHNLNWLKAVVIYELVSF
jgi:hypothetical protein